ncbi:MAG: zinc ribbon domain-containing protein [Holophagaceae bacterium]|uniref:Zinc ribbon domain-containing protein n=1 Tax=Candidatus Geothrix skivensis TaxID=2954439 RepID=A0A9D7SGX4_9BACT|nr:zinc ribbon domain-containing protein [Candidatus Geothrix skivensis]
MSQTSFSLQEQPAQPKAESPTGFFLQPWQKGTLLVIVLGILYLRVWRRKQARSLICSHCGKKNPPHQSNCMKCAAPLMRVD